MCSSDLPLPLEEEEEEAMGMVEMAEPMLVTGQLAEFRLVVAVAVGLVALELRVAQVIASLPGGSSQRTEFIRLI